MWKSGKNGGRPIILGMLELRMKDWKILLAIVGMVAILGGIEIYVKQEGEKRPETRKEEIKVEDKEERIIWTFGVGADVHNDIEVLVKVMFEAEKRGEKMMILAGDLTNEGKKAELIKIKKVLDESGMKYYVVPGNHDWWQSDRDKTDYWSQVWGKNYQSFKVDKIKFILVDNGRWSGLGKVQKTWLEGEVGECRWVECVVVMHEPLEHTISTHVMGEDNKAVTVEAGWLKKLLVDNGVKEIFVGHLHYASSYTIGGLKTNLVGAITSEKNYQVPRFTEVGVGESGWEEKVVEVE